MNGEFMTFEEVLRYLRLSEDEFMCVVREGAIRATRNYARMDFLRSQVQRLDLSPDGRDITDLVDHEDDGQGPEHLDELVQERGF